MKRDKRGRVVNSISQSDMEIVKDWIEKDGVTDRKLLALKIMMFFEVRSQITAEKYARIALHETDKQDSEGETAGE